MAEPVFDSDSEEEDFLGFTVEDLNTTASNVSLQDEEDISGSDDEEDDSDEDCGARERQ